MEQIDIKEQIGGLVKLQNVDAEIYDLKRQLEEKPEFLKSLQDQFETKKIKLHQLEEKHKAIQLDRKSKEGDLQVKDAAIAKANAQLSQIKNNKEYTAKIGEIESIKADKSIIEEKIIVAYDQADSIKTQIEKEKNVVQEEEQKYLQSKKSIDDEIKKIGQRIRELESQRGVLLPQINPAFLSRYERILVNKEGLAIVPVQGHSCGGCYMNVPAQVINEIKMYDELIYCEICSRILYLNEDEDA
ncbi:MAG TPA: C4-type zinc ribbon domain-containing protein [Candidatus Omnitrophota bacterium]|nr:C4-type zinc ribbon domain-containing protein [Candidatus Omnitrophota bacterium]